MTKVLYGSTALLHGYCPKCKDRGFANSELRCLDCGAEMRVSRKVKREVQGAYKRKRPGIPYQRVQLEAQGDACFWCRRQFGTAMVSKRGVVERLGVRWDHWIPFAFTGECDNVDFVAACQLCNGVKTSHMFDTEEECRLYVTRRVFAKGWREVDEMAGAA